MARRYSSNPWSKKSQKGLRSLNKIVGGTAKIAYWMYQDAKKTSQETSKYPIELQVESGILVGWIMMVLLCLFLCLYLRCAVALYLSVLILLFWIVFCRFFRWLYSPKRYMKKDILKDKDISKGKDIDKDLVVKITYAFVNALSFSNLIDAYKKLPLSMQKNTAIAALDKAILYLQDKGNIGESLQVVLDRFASAFNLTLSDIKEASYYMILVKLFVINDLVRGIVPERLNLSSSDIYVNLQKEEKIIWCFYDVKYGEYKKQNTYVGSSQGLSVKIVKGVYYKVGEFKSSPLTNFNLSFLGKGCLYVTTKNVYFYSDFTTIKIPYSNIISYVPLKNGIGIKENKKSNQMFFVDLDGWFAYNVFKNINNI